MQRARDVEENGHDAGSSERAATSPGRCARICAAQLSCTTLRRSLINAFSDLAWAGASQGYVVACVRRFDAGHRPGANRTAPCLWRCGADGAHGPLGRDAGLQHRRRADRHAFVNKADDAATSAMTLEHLLLGPIRPAPTDNAIKGALNLGV